MKENRQKRMLSVYIPISSLCLLIMIFIYQFFFYSPRVKIKKDDLAKEIEYANELINKGLYEYGAEAYNSLLSRYSLKDEKQANINYRLGVIYQDNMKDYEGALKYFYKINVVFPDYSMIGDVKKRIVICLERLNKTLDAENELSRFTSMNKKNKGPVDNSEIMAEIGDRKITYGEFDGYLRTLPEAVREQALDENTRKQLLQEFVVSEILYESALRGGYEDEKEVVNALEQAKKAILVNKLLVEKVGAEIKDVDPVDLKNYYEANISRYQAENSSNALPFEKVRERVLNDYLMEKRNVVYENYIRQLLRSKDVKIMGSPIR